MFCTKCGVKLEEGTKFCIKCGTPVNASPVPNTPPPVGAFGTVTPEQTRVNTAQDIANQPYTNTQANRQSPPQTAGLQNKKNTKRNVLIAAAGVVILSLVFFILPFFISEGAFHVYMRDDLDKAMRLYKINELNPFFRGDSYYFLGRIYLDKGQYDDAIRYSTKAIRLNPNDASVKYTYEYRGDAYMFKGEYDRAIEDFEEALRLHSLTAKKKLEDAQRARGK